MHLSYQQFTKDLTAICQKKGYSLTKIGSTMAPYSFPLYKVVLNEGSSNKRTVLFKAGLHGDETSGPMAILRFLKQYRSNESHPTIIVLPNCNPYGYEKGQHRNSQNLNLNRHFCTAKLTPETRILLKASSFKQLYFSATFHEDDIKQGAYIYGYNVNQQTPSIYRQLLNVVKKHAPICRDKQIYRQRAEDGLISKPKPDCSFSERMWLEGVPHVICVEVPDQLPMDTRIKVNVAIMNKVVAHSSTVATKKISRFKYTVWRYGNRVLKY